MVSWIDAVKEFAKQNEGKFVIPKKDTPEYLKIKAIQEKMTKGEAEPPVKAKKEKPVKKPAVEVKSEPVVEAPKKPKAPKTPNVAVPVEEPAPVVVKRTKKNVIRKEKSPNVAEVVEEPVVEVPPTPRVKKAKIPKTPNVEVKEEPAPAPVQVKKPRKTKKEVIADMKAKNEVAMVENSKELAKKALNESRLLRISREPVVMKFD
jgi:hypothetical protein